ncbi:MAG TPA: hypothetical protein PKA41_04535 [Verrucomicrobiota bacterium]|nr:hypothetical protein [Verrucomicrobiota bacterium]
MKPHSLRIDGRLTAVLAAMIVTSAQVHAANHFVSMTSSWTFAPSYLEIDAGDTVTWVNNDDFDDHDATSTGGGPSWSTGFVAPEDSSSPILFDTPGTYPYRDSIYGPLGMVGTIVVNAAPVTPDPSELSEPQRLTDGSFRFTISGLTPGMETVIASSTNLVDWTTVSTTFPETATLSYTNPPLLGATAEYFRCWQNP